MSHPQPDGYLAMPPSGAGRGVLVLHPWWGLNDAIRAFCDRLAKEGFVAFAADLYHGSVVDQIPEADTLSRGLFADLDRPRADVADALAYLGERATQPEDGLAVIGFSLGAFFALDLSVSAPEAVRSVVVFYGTRPGDYSRSQAAYLGHFAENDPFEPAADADALEEALRQAGCPVTFHRYPGTGHWFFEPDRIEAYAPAAAGLAWERTLAFLKGSTAR